MERPALQRKNAAPASILILGCDHENAEKVYDAVVEAVSSAAPSTRIRVLLTQSRRIV
jgi:hypothetical protein